MKHMFRVKFLVYNRFYLYGGYRIGHHPAFNCFMARESTVKNSHAASEEVWVQLNLGHRESKNLENCILFIYPIWIVEQTKVDLRYSSFSFINNDFKQYNILKLNHFWLDKNNLQSDTFDFLYRDIKLKTLHGLENKSTEGDILKYIIIINYVK